MHTRSPGTRIFRARALAACLVAALCALPACGDDAGEKGGGDKKAAGAGAAGDMASSLSLEEPKGFPCHSITTEVMESAPVQLGFMMVRDMPMPGYRIDVDEVKLADDKKTVVAKMTTIAPKGAGLTVLESRDIRFNMGSLAKGSYVFELHERTKEDGEYTRIGSFPFSAK